MPALTLTESALQMHLLVELNMDVHAWRLQSVGATELSAPVVNGADHAMRPD